MQNAFYREFYQTAMILAGINDKKTFIEPKASPDKNLSHFLIALQGKQVENEEYFHWSVAIYMADASGLFDMIEPIYSSAVYDQFNQAAAEAKQIEIEAINDQLHAILLQEKIS